MATQKKKKEKKLLFTQTWNLFALLDTLTYTVKGTVSQERGKKKEVAAFICYADSAERWNKKR